jgi:hypothetical protein
MPEIYIILLVNDIVHSRVAYLFKKMLSLHFEI